MKIIIHSLFPVILLMFAGTAKSQIHGTVAVLDFEAKGISAVEVSTLTDVLRDALVVTNKAQIIERAVMQSILAEQDFGLIGCTSKECVIKIGRLLQAHRIVAGSVGRVGSTYLITARIINVETGKILKSFRKEHRGSLDGLIARMDEVALELAGEKKDQVALAPERSSASRMVPPKARNVPRRTVNKYDGRWSPAANQYYHKGIEAAKNGDTQSETYAIMSLFACSGGVYLDVKAYTETGVSQSKYFTGLYLLGLSGAFLDTDSPECELNHTNEEYNAAYRRGYKIRAILDRVIAWNLGYAILIGVVLLSEI